MPERALLAVSHSASLGGAERNLAEVLDALVRTAAVDRVGVVLPAQGPLGSLLERREVSVFVEPVAWWIAKRRGAAAIASRWAGLLRSTRAVDGAIERFRPTLTLTSTLASPVLALASRRRAVPHVWFAQEFVTLDHELRFLYGAPLAAFAVRHTSDVVLGVSRALADHLAGFGVNNVAIVQPTLALFRPRSGSRPPSVPLRLVLPGSMQPGKGQLDAVRAIALLRARRREVGLTLVGAVTDYRYRAALEAEVARLGLSDGVSVDIQPPVDDVAAVMDEHDAVLVCSRAEAFGRVIVEAQLAGRVAVVSAGGAGPELVDDGVNGLLYQPGDPVALAEAVERLLDAQRYVALAEAGRRQALDRFSPEATAAAFSTAVGWSHRS